MVNNKLVEIKYYSKKPLGLSIDDIKGSMFWEGKKGNIKLYFRGGKKREVIIYILELKRLENNNYEITLRDLGSCEIQLIIDSRNLITLLKSFKKDMVKLGFKEKKF